MSVERMLIEIQILKVFWRSLIKKKGTGCCKLEKKINPYYKVAKNLNKLFSNVLWKLELGSGEIGHLGKEISKQVFANSSGYE